MNFQLHTYAETQTNMLMPSPVMLVTLHPPLETDNIAPAQREDPALLAVFCQLESKVTPPAIGDWLKFPLKRYRQIWSQLYLQDDTICRKVRSPTMKEYKLLFIFPRSKQDSLLRMSHEQLGHQGADRTLARLSDMAYWVGMARDVIRHCKHCRKCQITKAPEA